MDSGPVATHPSVSHRQLVLVGTKAEARTWAAEHGIDIGQLVVADVPRKMVGLNAGQVHIVVMRSFWDWRNPQHFMLKTEINFMSRKGATVEWTTGTWPWA